MRKEVYINKLCAGISSPAEQQAFREELQDHIETKMEMLMKKEDLSREQAEEKVIDEMGNIGETQRAMKRIHRTPDQVLKYVFLGLACLFGVFFILNIGGYALGVASMISNGSLPSTVTMEGLGIVTGDVGIIGGADGPTAIYVTTGWTTYLWLGLTIVFAVLAIVMFCMPAIRRRRNSR